MEANDSYSSQDGNNNLELKEWSHLCEEINHVDEYVKEIQQLLKDDRYTTLITMREAYNQNSASLADSEMKQEMSLKLEDVKQKLRSVSEKYLTGKSGVTFGSFGVGNYDSESVYLTPVSKLQNSAASRDEERSRSGMVVNSIGFNSSLKDASRSSSSSSSDSESDSEEPVVDKHLLRKPNGDTKPMELQGDADEVNIESDDMKSSVAAQEESMLQKMKQVLYEKFVERVSEYEKQLQAANEEIENSQEEISRLERKLTVGIEEVTRNMQSRLEAAHERVRALETELASERAVVLELRGKVSGLEAEVASRDCEIGEMGLVLNDARESFSREKSRYDAEILDLSENWSCSVKKLEEAQLKVSSLEDTIRECEAQMEREKEQYGAQMEMERERYEGQLEREREQCEVQQRNYAVEIERLGAELSERCEEVEKMNKSFDAKKLEYDMLMVQKDEQVAKMERLSAELKDQGIQIKEMEACISQLEIERAELVEEKGRVERELRVRVDELGKEIDRQSAVLTERAEEKREAIRQLCYSLEYYRNEYHELCRVFPRKKRQPVLAA